MFSSWQLILLSLGYIALLFFLAHQGDKLADRGLKRHMPFVYLMSLAVYCTSWSFLGTSAQAAQGNLSYLSIYLGPMLIFIFAWPMLMRLVTISQKQNFTSIADLLAARFGKSQKMAVTVTLIALLGTLPYLALQLKAIVYSFQLLQADLLVSDWLAGFLVSLVLAIFTTRFGIKNIRITERHPGLVTAIAFESLVKLGAFLLVGLYVCLIMFDGPTQIFEQSPELHFELPDITATLGLLVIVMGAFLCLPRQFHVMVVELRNQQDAKLSRFAFPLYLLIFAVFALPLGLAGQLLLHDQVPADAFVLFLPAQGGQPWLSMLAYLGAISAASSMLIISSIALSTMLSNEVLFPRFFNQQRKVESFNQFKTHLLFIRKSLIFIVLLAGYAVFLLTPADTLNSLGEMAFGAIVQLSPALFCAFYWRNANHNGVYAGLLTGIFCWIGINLLPSFGLYSLSLESPWLPHSTYTSLLSLMVNVSVLWFVSLFSRQSLQEQAQLAHFFPDSQQQQSTFLKRNIATDELELLLSGFVGQHRASEFIQHFSQSQQTQEGTQEYSQALVQQAEKLLTSIVGSSSARMIISSFLKGKQLALHDLATLLKHSSNEQQQLGHDLLQSAIENAGEGISIIDKDAKLVAWNSKYQSLFNYPEELILKGSPIANLIRFNARRGLSNGQDIESFVQKRLQHLKNGSPHSSERILEDGSIIRIQGNPLPDGGFVMMFSDITHYREAEKLLRHEKLDLQQLLAEKNLQLQQLRDKLKAEQKHSQQASEQKSRYLHACSHDLMQPLEAARLYCSAMSHGQQLNPEQQQQLSHIDHSLKLANELLTDLSEVARLDSGKIKPQFSQVKLNDIFQSLQQEFQPTAKALGSTLRIISTSQYIDTDAGLLHRILQNLLSNALRYASPGKILLGCRHKSDKLLIQIIDQGPGIPVDKQQLIFEQFTRLQHINHSEQQGLGLGLNIASNLAELMEHPLGLISVVNRGSCFSLEVPVAIPAPSQVQPQKVLNIESLKDVRVLCIDNDPSVLNGLAELLRSWQCQVETAGSAAEAREIFASKQAMFDILLVDYQLEESETGLALLSKLLQNCPRALPAILITANTDPAVAQQAAEMGVGFMRKMIKPAALRAMMSSKLASALYQAYSDSSS